MSEAKAFAHALQQRRSIYNLGHRPLALSDEEIVELIKDIVREAPTSFNVQSARALILLGAEHTKLWEATIASMKAVGVKGEALEAAKKKVQNCFANAVGTVLFYEDTNATNALKKKLPLYAPNFDSFSLQANAMAQYAVWTALAQSKIGASLQHYNEIIEKDVAKLFGVPASWKLTAQIVFGSIEKPAKPRTYIPDEGRFIVKGLPASKL